MVRDLEVPPLEAPHASNVGGYLTMHADGLGPCGPESTVRVYRRSVCWFLLIRILRALMIMILSSTLLSSPLLYSATVARRNRAVRATSMRRPQFVARPSRDGTATHPRTLCIPL